MVVVPRWPTARASARAGSYGPRMSLPFCGPVPAPLTLGQAAALALAAETAIRDSEPVAWVGGSAASFDSLRQRDISAATAARQAVDAAAAALDLFNTARALAQLAYQGIAPVPGVPAGAAGWYQPTPPSWSRTRSVGS